MVNHAMLPIQESSDEKCVELTIGDDMTGQIRTTMVTFEQLGAIVGTSICSTNEKIMQAAEPLVKEAIGHFPRELQPSPVC